MRIPRRGEKGFTLVELLIVLAILAVLAAVVIPNVTGMFGRGAAQAWDTDLKTIQTAAFTFYFDTHRYDGSGHTWQNLVGSDGHYYPTMYGNDTYNGTDKLGVDPTNADPDTSAPKVVKAGTITPLTDVEVSGAAIWMGLLVNAPTTGIAGGIDGLGATGDLGNAERRDVCTLKDASVTPPLVEKGLYLNEMPKSAIGIVVAGGVPGNGGTAGTYLWVVGENGKVYGIYRKAADTWYAGFGGKYP